MLVDWSCSDLKGLLLCLIEDAAGFISKENLLLTIEVSTLD